MNTFYFKYFHQTPRYPNLKEAIDDLFVLFPYEDCPLMSIYDSFKDNPKFVITNIWTESQKITKLINFALIVDAGKHFDFDKTDMAFFEDCIINEKKHEEQIIKYSIKFMRLLNSYIAD